LLSSRDWSSTGMSFILINWTALQCDTHSFSFCIGDFICWESSS
jgi:hypothetical protein